jgi:C_GCAxxG_C_C family probable redox protein
VAAENYYRDGDFFCSEAVVKTIKDAFRAPFSDEIVALASGFPVGMGGSGCTCGAVSGGIMAIGMFFGRSHAKGEEVVRTMALSKELHDFFKDKHKCLCCRALTSGMTLGSKEHMDQCISLTGEVAERTARIIDRELRGA